MLGVFIDIDYFTTFIAVFVSTGIILVIKNPLIGLTPLSRHTSLTVTFSFKSHIARYYLAASSQTIAVKVDVTTMLLCHQANTLNIKD